MVKRADPELAQMLSGFATLGAARQCVGLMPLTREECARMIEAGLEDDGLRIGRVLELIDAELALLETPAHAREATCGPTTLRLH
ncbi:MAG: hypothetical protein OXH79_03110 [Boseongicola sp.]|nr:hypothetical protein [Boseongicola sp.]